MQVIAEEHYGLKKCLLSLNVFLPLRQSMSLSRAGSCCGWYLLSDHTLKAQEESSYDSCFSSPPPYCGIELVENESFFLENIEKWIIFLSNLTFVLTILFDWYVATCSSD